MSVKQISSRLRRSPRGKNRVHDVRALLWACDLCDREFPVVVGTAVGTGDTVSLLCPLCVNALGGDRAPVVSGRDGSLLAPAGEWGTLFRSHETEDVRNLDAPEPADVSKACELYSKPSSALTLVDEGYVPRKACPDCAEALKSIVEFALEQPRGEG